MEKKSIFSRIWDKFKEDPVYSIWFILGIVEVVVTLVVLIVGIVNFRTTGYYIAGDTYRGKDAENYVFQSKFGFLVALFAIQFILSLVEGLRYNLGRTIAALSTTVVWGVLAAVFTGAINVGINTQSTVSQVLSAVFGLGLPFVIFLLYKGTTAGRMIFITVILIALYSIGTVLILTIQQHPVEAILFIVAFVAAWFFVPSGDTSSEPSAAGVSSYGGNDNIGAPSTPYYTSAPSRASYSDAREMTKTQDEIDRLRRKNEEMENAIKMHNRGALGYGYVDNKVTRRGIEENERRIKNLEKSLH